MKSIINNLDKYLGFFFNQKLMFHHYIDFYTNKAISTIKCMKMLGNLLKGLVLFQKKTTIHLVYITHRSIQLSTVVL